MDDGERVSILTPGSSGSDPKKPMELVVDIPRTIQGYSDYYGERHKIINKTLSVNSTYPKPQYIYYKLYTEDGEIPSKHPIYPDAEQSRSLARIDAKLVPPPHTLHAVIRCISFFEGFSYNGWHQIFNDIVSEFPVRDGVLVLRSGSPGSMPERPLAFVQSAHMDKPIMTKSRNNWDRPAGLLGHGVGVALYTDGVVRREVLAGGYHTVYRVRNAEGEHGLVMKEDVLHGLK